MADLSFRINIETEAGNTRSYYTSSFAKTTESNVSASVLTRRIQYMGSASYDSNAGAPSAWTATPNFGELGYGGPTTNPFLSASYDNEASGSIKFTHTDDEDTADPLKRYRFFGTKVCNVLGLPEGQWIYPENFHLDDSGGTNYFSGDVAATNLSLTNGFTMANTATMRSNLRFDTVQASSGSDLFVQFTTGSGAFQSNALLLGFNSDTDTYVLDKGDENNLHINATTAVATALTGSNFKVQKINSFTDDMSQIDMSAAQNLFWIKVGDAWIFIDDNSDPGSITMNANTGGSGDFDIDFRVKGESEDNLIFADASADKVGIGTNTPSKTLDVVGDIACSGAIVGGTRAYFDGGEASAFSSDRYLDFNNGTQMDDYEGYRMHRAGSITGVSCQFNCTTNAGGDVDIEVRKNGVKVFEKASVSIPDTNAATRYGDSATQARGTDTFVVGDVLTLYVCVNGSVTLDDFNAFFEVTFDT